MCSMVTGGRLGRLDDSGAILATPLVIAAKTSPPSHGAPWNLCQKWRPANHELTVVAAIFPAQLAQKADKSHSAAGMRLASVILCASQN
jgi:hypothetical protein